MPVSTHLLERAHQLIKAKQYENAALVLDAVVRVDPKIVDGWKSYLQIQSDVCDLNWLKERILRTNELCDADKKNILDYQNYLIQQWTEKEEEDAAEKNENTLSYPDDDHEQQEFVTLELVDIFDYPELVVEKTRKRKPRRRYTPRVSAASGHAILLFALLLLGIRLLALQHLLGYALLLIFVYGGVLWLEKYSIRLPATFINANRTYALEHTNKLTIVDKSQGKIEEQEPNYEELDKVNIDSIPRI